MDFKHLIGASSQPTTKKTGPVILYTLLSLISCVTQEDAVTLVLLTYIIIVSSVYVNTWAHLEIYCNDKKTDGYPCLRENV